MYALFADEENLIVNQEYLIRSVVVRKFGDITVPFTQEVRRWPQIIFSPLVLAALL